MRGLLSGRPCSPVRLVLPAVLLLFVLGPASAGAETFRVATSYDCVDLSPGDGVCRCRTPSGIYACSLRAAVMEANALPGDDTIELPARHYDLGLTTGDEGEEYGDLDVTSFVTIEGEGEDETIIDANQIDRVLEVHPGASLRLTDTTVLGGRRSGGGGAGIFNRGTFRGERCTVRDNHLESGDMMSEGAGITSTEKLYITDSTLRDNSVNCDMLCSGEAINSSGDICEIVRTTVVGNAGVSGWSAIAVETATFENCTLFNAEIVVSSSIYLKDCTVSYPGHRVLELHPTRSTILANTIVEGECDSSLGAIVESRGGNLESPGHSCGLLHFTDQDDVADPRLAPLDFYGGLTETMALLPGSPAINSGNNTFCATVDQRSAPRTDGACDVGAYEYGATPPNMVFMDGFELGDTGAWSQTVP